MSDENRYLCIENDSNGFFVYFSNQHWFFREILPEEQAVECRLSEGKYFIDIKNLKYVPPIKPSKYRSLDAE